VKHIEPEERGWNGRFASILFNISLCKSHKPDKVKLFMTDIVIRNEMIEATVR